MARPTDLETAALEKTLCPITVSAMAWGSRREAHGPVWRQRQRNRKDRGCRANTLRIGQLGSLQWALGYRSGPSCSVTGLGVTGAGGCGPECESQLGEWVGDAGSGFIHLSMKGTRPRELFTLSKNSLTLWEAVPAESARPHMTKHRNMEMKRHSQSS